MTLNVAARRAPPELVADLGAELAGTIDIVESHHEEDLPEQVTGVVTAVFDATLLIEEHMTLRRPGHGAPPDAVMPAEGQEWPRKVTDLGGGVTMRSQPSRHIAEVRRIPGTASITPAPGVLLPMPERPGILAPTGQRPSPRPEKRTLLGWLVDLDPGQRPDS